MYHNKQTRRDFLIGAGTGLVAIAQSTVPSLFAAQVQPVNGFDALRTYGIQLYEETNSYNYQRDENGNFRRRLDHEESFPILFDGEMSGRSVHVWVAPKLPSDPYSLETKVYASERDISFSGDWADLGKNLPSKIFYDSGFKGNLRGRSDIVANLSMGRETMEYALFTGDGGYYYAHFVAPKQGITELEMEIEIGRRVVRLINETSRLGFSEGDRQKLLSILTSFDHMPATYGHSFNFMPSFLDGAAWYTPSGVLQSYMGLMVNMKEIGLNVGNRSRLIGSYSRTNHATLQRRREQALQSGNLENGLVLQKTIGQLVQDRKIKI